MLWAVQTTGVNYFHELMKELEADYEILSDSVRKAALMVWRRETDRGTDAERAVREAMPVLLTAAADAGLPAKALKETKAKTRVGDSVALDRAQARVLVEQAVRLADRDSALKGGGRAWRDYPVRSVRAGSDWAGRWEDIHVDGPGGPAILRMRRDPILLELSDERPRIPTGQGFELAPLVMAARRVALVFNWSEADGLHFLMSGKVPTPIPLVARRLYGADGRTGASIAILAAAHVNPESVKKLFAEEQRRHFRRGNRRGGRGLEERNVELVRFVESWIAKHGSLDFEQVRKAWNRGQGKRPGWNYRFTSWVSRDYNRTAKAILGRAIKPRHATRVQE